MTTFVSSSFSTSHWRSSFLERYPILHEVCFPQSPTPVENRPLITSARVLKQRRRSIYGERCVDLTVMRNTSRVSVAHAEHIGLDSHKPSLHTISVSLLEIPVFSTLLSYYWIHPLPTDFCFRLLLFKTSSPITHPPVA